MSNGGKGQQAAPGVTTEAGAGASPRTADSVSGQKVEGTPSMSREELERLLGQKVNEAVGKSVQELGLQLREFLAAELEKDGYYAAAARLRGKTFKAMNFKDRAKVAWSTPITVGHVIIAVGVAGAVWLVYEGVAYLLKGKFPNLPSLLRDGPNATIRSIRPAASSSR